VTHCSRDTTGWFVMLDLAMVVFMMFSRGITSLGSLILS
jgi:hypothetical protein